MPKLPMGKTPKRTNLSDYIILLYGHPKVGKSTLASQMDNPLFIATEAGLNSLEVYQVPVKTWPEFLEICAAIDKEKHQFKTIVIDTITNLFKFCSAYVCQKNGIAHESELGFGKGWHLVKEEFFRAITKLSLLPLGLVFICHADIVEVKTRTITINRQVPNLPKQAYELITTMSDFIFLCDMEDKAAERFIRTKPSESWVAGDRTGRLPNELPMNYIEIQKALDNAMKNEGGII
ncbi:ATP-binding protein [Niallia endozanthoxylica]|uniref:ATP-binding protein n=1 Tax=Niallia endozanthoxylica TaxID=2036016 RepID=UPI001CC4D2A9|nr:ATP-binding protein [Niallia endozanthoxylica]